MPAPAPLAIIAGGGAVALQVACSAQEAGRNPFVALLSGSAQPADYQGFDCAEFGLGQLGGLFAAFKARKIREVTLIGAVTRPALSDIKPDFGLITRLPALAGAFRKGDDGLLSAIVAALEDEGLTVVSALDVAPDLAARTAGALARKRVDANAAEAIALGLRVIEALSPFDAGQCVVVAGGRPVAIEGAEGTDQLLTRVADLRRAGRLRLDDGGILVKAPKRGQNMRVDLPTIGPATIERAHAAGLDGVAIAVGRVLIAERARTLALADAHGLFLEATP